MLCVYSAGLQSKLFWITDLNLAWMWLMSKIVWLAFPPISHIFLASREWLWGGKSRNSALKVVLAVFAGRAAVGTAVSAPQPPSHSCIQVLWCFNLTITALLLLFQHPVHSCPSPPWEFCHLCWEKLRNHRGLRKWGGVEQRGLRLEGAIAAAASQDNLILRFTCGTHYLNLLEQGEHLPEWCWVDPGAG